MKRAQAGLVCFQRIESALQRVRQAGEAQLLPSDALSPPGSPEKTVVPQLARMPRGRRAPGRPGPYAARMSHRRREIEQIELPGRGRARPWRWWGRCAASLPGPCRPTTCSLELQSRGLQPQAGDGRSRGQGHERRQTPTRPPRKTPPRGEPARARRVIGGGLALGGISKAEMDVDAIANARDGGLGRASWRASRAAGDFAHHLADDQRPVGQLEAFGRRVVSSNFLSLPDPAM